MPMGPLKSMGPGVLVPPCPPLGGPVQPYLRPKLTAKTLQELIRNLHTQQDQHALRKSTTKD